MQLTGGELYKNQSRCLHNNVLARTDHPLLWATKYTMREDPTKSSRLSYKQGEAAFIANLNLQWISGRIGSPTEIPGTVEADRATEPPPSMT